MIILKELFCWDLFSTEIDTELTKQDFMIILGIVHKWRQPRGGGEGVGQKLTKVDKEGGGDFVKSWCQPTIKFVVNAKKTTGEATFGPSDRGSNPK